MPSGRTEDVQVTITAIYATRTLHALLYEDTGKPGIFEKEIDWPILLNNTPVTVQFNQIVE